MDMDRRGGWNFKLHCIPQKNQSTYEMKLELFRMFGITTRVTVFITATGAVEVNYEIINNAFHNIMYVP
jgi:hypothetical protein